MNASQQDWHFFCAVGCKPPAPAGAIKVQKEKREREEEEKKEETKKANKLKPSNIMTPFSPCMQPPEIEIAELGGTFIIYNSTIPLTFGLQFIDLLQPSLRRLTDVRSYVHRAHQLQHQKLHIAKRLTPAVND
jgi:hypothetical protein